MKIFSNLFLFGFIIGTMLFSSCKKEITLEPFDYEKQAEIDDAKIKDYLTVNNINALKDSSGVYYNILVEGDSIYPKLNSIVEIKYKGYFLNGNVFDESTENSIEFYLDNLILGWQIGIPYISKGGQIQLFIPSNYGYGPNDYYSIPGKSVLIFEVELINVK